MNFKPDEDSDLIERYRLASQAQGAIPSESAREAILAEGRRVAAQRAEAARQAFDTQQPAANQPRWRLAAYGSLGAAVFAVVLMLPRFWEPNRDEVVVTTESRRAAQPDAPVTAAVPATPTPAPAPADAMPQAPLAESQPAPSAAAKQNRRQEPALQSIQRPSPAAPPHYTSAPAALAGVEARARLGAGAQPSLPAAVTAGDAGRLTQLLDQGLSPQQADSAGRTPLLLAVIAKRPDMVQLLLARGADPNAADPAGETPLQRARRDNLPGIAALLEAAGAH
jgi:hypothetical protein